MYLCSRMIADFVRYLEAERRYSPLTVRNYRHDVEQFLAWLGVDDARFEPQRITTDDIREWILYRTETGRVSAASMNREISSLRALFRWLLRTGAVGRDVVHPIPSLRTSQRLPAFVPESRMGPQQHRAPLALGHRGDGVLSAAYRTKCVPRAVIPLGADRPIRAYP